MKRWIPCVVCLLCAQSAFASAKESPKEPPGKVVTLSFATTPRAVAQITWGKKLLGKTPLTLKWPRDSGPLDVVITAPGYVPVHSRVQTFRDDRLHVKLTKVEEKHTLFGYKKEVPPPAPIEGQPGQPQPGQPPQVGQPPQAGQPPQVGQPPQPGQPPQVGQPPQAGQPPPAQPSP